MRFGRIAAALAVTAVVGTGLAQGTASAMTTNSVDDGDKHPAVVALLYVDGDLAEDGVAFVYCSGMLMSPTVVLTAGHCNDGTEEYATTNGWSLAVTNDPQLTVADGDGWVTVDSGTYAPVTAIRPNPLYKRGYRDDVSVQIIEPALTDVTTSDFGLRPEVGMLDKLQKSKTLKSTPVTVVGYGTEQKSLPANTSPTFPDSNMRRYADLPTIALDKQWIHQDQNLGKSPDQGGACYGDSGGPSIIEDGDNLIVVAVTSTGDGPCFATNVASRVDTPSARAFLDTILAEEG